MSSAKTERLVNLTMALLGSKRYMPKSEIFRRVAGYSGAQETKERMFERDKDDLRALGIEIEVASHDPLFEDEPGYRIRSDRYRLPQQAFSGEELGIISVALGMLTDGQFADTTRALLRRINSLLVSPTSPDEIEFASSQIDESGLAEIANALARKMTIEFSYLKFGAEVAEVRRVNPLGLSAWRGSWYLVGEDHDRGDVRVFKLERISTTPQIVSRADAYEIPADFSVRDYVVMLKSDQYQASLKVRAGSGISIRGRATKIAKVDDEWDEVQVNFPNEATALREILWLGPDVVVVSPIQLRESVIANLTKLVANG